MRYVVDSSVAIKWVLPESDSDKALRLLVRARSNDVELLAPDFFPVECGHAFFRAERRGLIPTGRARLSLISLMTDCPSLRNAVHYLSRGSAICQHIRTGFYDAIYMALAEDEQCSFVTADERLVANALGHYPYLTPLSSFK